MAMRIAAMMIVGCIMLMLQFAQAWQSPPNRNDSVALASRRFFTGSLLSVLATTSPANAASKYCASGVGEGCDDLSEGNSYIKSLQEKSAAKKQQYADEALNAFYNKNYPDFFASTGKTMIKRSDGTFFLVNSAELEDLKKENKVMLVAPKTFGGRITDLSQRPVLTLRD